MKIVGKDVYDREYIPDKLIVENVSEYYGNRIINLLNDSESYATGYFYKLVEDDYHLRTIEDIYE